MPRVSCLISNKSILYCSKLNNKYLDIAFYYYFIGISLKRIPTFFHSTLFLNCLSDQSPQNLFILLFFKRSEIIPLFLTIFVCHQQLITILWENFQFILRLVISWSPNLNFVVENKMIAVLESFKSFTKAHH